MKFFHFVEISESSLEVLVLAAPFDDRVESDLVGGQLGVDFDFLENVVGLLDVFCAYQ